MYNIDQPARTEVTAWMDSSMYVSSTGLLASVLGNYVHKMQRKGNLLTGVVNMTYHNANIVYIRKWWWLNCHWEALAFVGRCSLRLFITHLIKAGHYCKEMFVVWYSHLSATTNTVRKLQLATSWIQTDHLKAESSEKEGYVFLPWFVSRYWLNSLLMHSPVWLELIGFL